MTDKIVLKRIPEGTKILKGGVYYFRGSKGVLNSIVLTYDLYAEGDEYIEEVQLPTEPGSVITEVVLTDGTEIPLLVRTFCGDSDPWLDPKSLKTGLWVRSDQIKSFTLAKVVPA